jgi:Rha family phage regulatory protein
MADRKTPAGVMVPGMVFNRGGSILTNSQDVAAFFGKRHDNVIRDIDGLIGHSSDLRDGVSRHFTMVEVAHPTVAGRRVRTLDMDRTGLTLLAMGFTGSKALKWKLLYIEAFDKMEAMLRAGAGAGPVRLHDPAELRGLLLDYTERVIELEGANARLAPKAAALDLLATKTGDENITTTAKGLKMHPGDLFQWLDKNGWIHRTHPGAPWRAYQTKIDAGLLVVRETPDKTRDDRSFMQVLVTPKGRTKLALLLSQGKML